MRKKFTMLLASLFLTVGTAWALEFPTNGVYSIAGGPGNVTEGFERGYLVAGEGYDNYPVLTEIKHTSSVGNSVAPVEDGKYWYVRLVEGSSSKYYIFNIAKQKFLVNNGGNINFGNTPYVWTFEVKNNTYYNIKDEKRTEQKKYMSMGCGTAPAGRPIQWDSNTDDGGAKSTFIPLEGGTDTYQTALTAADAKIVEFENTIEVNGTKTVNWTPDSWEEGENIPEGATSVEHGRYPDRVSNVYMMTLFSDFNLTIGKLQTTLQYDNGSNRLDILGVDLLDEQGEVVSHDYHFGYSGLYKDKNIYSVMVENAGKYTLRCWVTYCFEGNTSNGTVTIKHYDLAAYKELVSTDLDNLSLLAEVFDSKTIKSAKTKIKSIATSTDISGFNLVDAEFNNVLTAVSDKIFTFQNSNTTDENRSEVYLAADMSDNKGRGNKNKDENAFWRLYSAGGTSFYLYNEFKKVYLGAPNQEGPLTSTPEAAYTFEVVDAAASMVELKYGEQTLHVHNWTDCTLTNYDGDESASRWYIKNVTPELPEAGIPYYLQDKCGTYLDIHNLGYEETYKEVNKMATMSATPQPLYITASAYNKWQIHTTAAGGDYLCQYTGGKQTWDSWVSADGEDFEWQVELTVADGNLYYMLKNVDGSNQGYLGNETHTTNGGVLYANQPGDPQRLKLTLKEAPGKFLTVSDLDAVSYPYALTDEQAAIVFGRENLTIAFDITTASSLAGRGAAICAADPTAGVPTTGVANNSTYVAYGHYGTWAAYFPSSKDGDRFSFDGNNGNLDPENNKFSGSTNYKVVYVIDKVNQKNSLYVNGELWGETTYPKSGYTLQSFSNFEVAAGHKLYIGGGVTSTSNGYDLFDGTIHSAQFFNTVLTAEEIADIEYPVTTLQQDPDFMTKADAAHSAMNIYGLQRHFGLVQDGGAGIEGNGQFECNFPASTSQESGNAYANLIDGSYTSFFHSGYNGTRGDGSAHYLQATLSKPVKSFRFYFKKRSQNNNNRPIEILIEGSTNGDAFSEITTINTGLPTDENVLDYYSDAINTATAYKHLRFTIKKTNGDQSSGNPFFTFSEFYILPTYAKVNEAFDAVRNYRSARSISTAKALIESSVWNSVLTYGTPAIGMDHFIYADTKQGDGSYVSRYLYNKSGALATSTSPDAKNNMYVWRAAQPEGTTYFTFQNVGDEAKYIGYGNSGSGLTIHTAPVQLDIQSSYAVHAGSVGIKRIGDDSNGKFMVTAADGSSFNRNSSAVNNGSWCSDYMFVPADLYDGMFTFTIVDNTPLAEAVYVWNEIEHTEGTSVLYAAEDVITSGTLAVKSHNPTYTFIGFYSDADYTTPITEVTELTEDKTIYAKFTLNIFSEKYGDKWVRLSNCSNTSYWATVEGTATDGKGKTATLDYADEKQLWCLVGDASSFVLYNKAAGESLSLDVPLAENATYGNGNEAKLTSDKGTWKLIEQDFGYALAPTTKSADNAWGINMYGGAGGYLKLYGTAANNTGSYWTVQLADVANPLTFSVEVDKVWESSPRVAELTLTIDGASSQTRILDDVDAKKMYLPVGATFSLSSMTYRGYTFNGFGGEDSYENATLPEGGLEITASYTANNERTLFYSPSATGHPYRIPAIATAPNGDIFAICDHRPCGADIGNGDVDIVCRISSDNGVTWDDEIVLANGDGGSTNRMETGYGDPAIVVDRESNKILVMMVAGRTVCGNSRWDASKIGVKDAAAVNRAARVYGTLNESTGEWEWTQPEEVTDDIYKLFLDESNNATVTSYFIGSGKICQSRVVKKGEYYRLYCALWTRDQGNRVIYSDDFGGTWNVLGTIADRPATGGDEPKCEELPDGSVVLSSRVSGGRWFNIFTFNKDGEYTTGTWGTATKSTSAYDGSGNGTNGEIYKVKAIRKEDGKICDVMLQSVPAGPARTNVTVWYKEMDYTTAYTPATFAADWKEGKKVSDTESAYSTMHLQADGRIGFFFEEAPGGYTMVYIPYTLEDLTAGKYSLYTVTSTITDAEIGTFYASEAVQIPEGVKAYVADENNLADGVITMTQLEDIIPAHTGAVLRGEADSYEFIPSISYGTPVEGNLLVGHEAANSKDTDANRLSVLISENPSASIYVLANDSEGAKFYKKSTNFTVKNNKAYLKIPNATLAQGLRIRFGNEENGEGGTTSIDEGQLTIDNGQLTIYDLQGRRVLTPTKGMYIVNGKKIVIK